MELACRVLFHPRFCVHALPQTGRILPRCIRAGRARRKESNRVKRCYSLKRNKEFRHVYRKGQSKACKQLVLIYARTGANRKPPVHVGFSVSKKIGNSVVRNRVKRRLRESFGPMIPCVKDGYNLIFIAREPVVGEKFTVIQSTMRGLLRKADLLKKEETRQ